RPAEFVARLETGKDQCARASVLCRRHDHPGCGDLRFCEALLGLITLTLENLWIEMALRRVFDQTIFYSIQRVTFFEDGLMNDGVLTGGYVTLFVFKHCLTHPYTPGIEMRLRIFCVAGKYAVKIVRVTLGLNQRLPAAC